MKEGVGRHLIMDLRECKANNLDDAVVIEKILREAADMINVTVLASKAVQYTPSGDKNPGNGVAAVLILSESHISIHTYPETGEAYLDIFSCGETDPELASPFLLSQFKADPLSSKTINIIRGD